MVGWTEETFERLRNATPEALVSRMRVNHSMILNVINQPADPVATLRALMEDNHEDERGRARLAEQARSLSEELLASGVLEALAEPDEHGRTLRLAPALQADFALNQPLASFAQVRVRPRSTPRRRPTRSTCCRWWSRSSTTRCRC